MQRFPYFEERRPKFEVIPTCANLELFHRARAGTRLANLPLRLAFWEPQLVGTF